MMLVGEHLRHHAGRVPAKTALIDARTRIAYGDLNALVNRIAVVLEMPINYSGKILKRELRARLGR